MNKKDIIRKVAADTGCSQKVVGEVLNATFDSIVELVVAGNEINIPGFAKFYSEVKEAGNRRNPQTGNMIFVEARNYLKIKPSIVFKEAVKAS